MTVTAAVVAAEDEDPLGGPAPVGDPVVELLVGRLHAEYGVDRHEIRSLATEVLGTFASAPVQAFVPILVEKRLRETYRLRRDVRPDPPAGAVPRPR
ncbi:MULTISPECIES: three-helix bundle dimerization domain-containing protein [unclassified Geodermatophilus]